MLHIMKTNSRQFSALLLKAADHLYKSTPNDIMHDKNMFEVKFDCAHYEVVLTM